MARLSQLPLRNKRAFKRAAGRQTSSDLPDCVDGTIQFEIAVRLPRRSRPIRNGDLLRPVRLHEEPQRGVSEQRSNPLRNCPVADLSKTVPMLIVRSLRRAEYAIQEMNRRDNQAYTIMLGGWPYADLSLPQ